ncbi:MAG: type II toxin-antitoxin system HicA family toxin [Paludibacteraceae bacterium]|jgi:predicted RNA binding protein YcfA (HicA-like mRNA interferase family)|nr:type II toxin-antitoxin system HicA family toxin [Paludibacteraceae bacterium]
MKYSEVIRILKKHGCYLVSHGGNHDKWFSPITNRYFMLPRHISQEAKNGTVKSISKQSGVNL